MGASTARNMFTFVMIPSISRRPSASFSRSIASILKFRVGHNFHDHRIVEWRHNRARSKAGVDPDPLRMRKLKPCNRAGARNKTARGILPHKFEPLWRAPSDE